MFTIIVPTDFSDTARNAVDFALKMANDMHNVRVVLYNAYSKSAIGVDGTPLSVDPDANRQITVMALQNLRNEFPVRSGLAVDILAEEGELTSNLASMAGEKKADLVIMGINGASRIEQVLIGSSTLSVVHKASIPVLIVPPDAVYKKIRKVLFCSDLKEVEKTTPVDHLKTVLDMFGPKLVIGHVSTNHYNDTMHQQKVEIAKLNEMLVAYEPEFAVLPMGDFTESTSQLATDKQVDLLITVPRKHSFFEKLISPSHTKKLAYHSHLPVLAIPDIHS
ncbi:MAG: universal stress protein [Sphingobacteriales bacterium]|jgi:nucleotide-binding universal stress UspA family protein